MELICYIEKSPQNQCSNLEWRHFWGSVIIATKDEESIGRPKSAHLFLRSLVGDENKEIIQRYANVEWLEIELKDEYKVHLYSKESLYNIYISQVPPAQLETFAYYLQELSSQDTSKLNLPSVSDVSRSLFQLPLSLVNVNGDEEYSMEVELKEDLEHVISLSIQNCSLTTPIGSKKMKNLRSLWLENSVIRNNDVFQVESREIKELHVCECEIQFEITSLFQNKLNFIDSLTELYLEHNQWSQVPDGVFQFPNLIKLYLNHNRLTQLPDKFSKLPKLEVLWVAHNQLEYLPCSLLSLQLKDLYISRNNFVFDTKEPGTNSKKVHSLMELTYRKILNDKLVWKEEKLPKLMRETLANHQQCCCGCKFIDEGQAVAFLFRMDRISKCLHRVRNNHRSSFPLRGVVCSSLKACLFRRFRNVNMNSSRRWRN